VPGFGNVSDDEAICLIDAGRAAPFVMESNWTQSVSYDPDMNSIIWE
jgi:hypothetical protein